MTCKEKLAIEHPNRIGDFFVGGCACCPHYYGYLDEPDFCPHQDPLPDGACRTCWDREIPEDNEAAQTATTPRILDSGNRREFESGAVRDIQEGKGRCDLLPLDVVADFMETYDIDNNTHLHTVFDEIAQFLEDGDVEHLHTALLWGTPWDNVFTMILEVSKHFEEGARKYGDRNWEKGIPVRCYIDSAVRHYLKFLREDMDEPHDRAFCWNIMCAIWTCKHHPELNEYAKKET